VVLRWAKGSKLSGIPAELCFTLIFAFTQLEFSDFFDFRNGIQGFLCGQRFKP
jgi:hypothetical protein